MSEIAAAAGVSVPTVSKVVNGRPDVAPQTRQAIEKLLVARGYTSNRDNASKRAGSLRDPARGNHATAPVGLIDLVFVDLGSPWAMAILAGVEEVAYRAGTGVAVSAVHGRHRTRPDDRWLENLAARRCDGVLLILSELTARQQRRLVDLGVPVVIVDPAGAPPPGIPSVGATNWAGGLSAVEHLVSLGHSRVACIGGPTDVLCSRARVAGYRAAMGAAGLDIPSGYVRYGDFMSGTGYRQTMALLDLPEPPTAIFVCSDQMALGAYEALYERGIRVPDGMSIVGFDDLDEAKWAIPPLTTVRQPLSEMAGMATRMLLALIGGEELETNRVELSTSLVIRQSTRAL
jgi:LacI family transcriptional regulator, galactose operon repressor